MRGSLLWLFWLVSFSVTAGPQIEHWRTAEGIPVYLVRSHQLPMLDVQIIFDAGSVREPADRAGLASLTNGLLAEAADGMNADEIGFEFERLGAVYDSFSGYDSASVSLRSLVDPARLRPALATLRRVMSQPDYLQEDLDRARNRVLVGIQRKQQSPSALSSDAFDAAIFGEHPYGRPNEGTPETLAAITRDDLIAFHQRYYTASNAMVAMVGDIDRESAERIAAELTRGLPEGERPGVFPALSMSARGDLIRIDHPSSQVHIVMGQPGMRYGDPDYFPLYVGNHILGGGGLVSRLFEEVREKRGLSYSASSYFSPRRESGPFRAQVQTRQDQVDEAVTVLRDTISHFIEEGPTAAELEAAKKNLTGGFALRIDSNSKIAGYLGVIGFYGLPLDYLDVFNDRIEAVTLEEIRDAFRRRLDVDDFVTVLVGPVTANETPALPDTSD